MIGLIGAMLLGGLAGLGILAVGTKIGLWILNRKDRKRGHRGTPKDAHRGADPDPLAIAAAEHQARLATRVGAIGTRAGAVEARTGADPGVDEDPDFPAIPDLIEPILGWRCWTVSADGYLHALNAGLIGYGLRSKGPKWEPKKAVVAQCNSEYRHQHELRLMESDPTYEHQEHIAPMTRCSCGFYASRLLRNAQFPYDSFAYGIVAMWGKVEEHNDGWRAQYAYPVSLTLIASHEWDSPGEKEKILATVRAAYGVPARYGTKEELESLCVEQLATEPLPEQIASILTGER